MCNGGILHIRLDKSDEHCDQYIIQSCQAGPKSSLKLTAHSGARIYRRTQEPGLAQWNLILSNPAQFSFPEFVSCKHLTAEAPYEHAGVHVKTKI